MTKFTIPHLIGGPKDGEVVPALSPETSVVYVGNFEQRTLSTLVYVRRHVGPIYGWVYDDPGDWDGPHAEWMILAAVGALAEKAALPATLEDNDSRVLGYPAELVLRMQDGPLSMPLPISTDAFGGEPRFNWRDAAAAIDAWRAAGKR